MYERYVQLIQRRLPLFLLLSFVMAAGAYGAIARRGPLFEVHFSYLVSLAEREELSEYTFDGFYALQATESFAATLAGWTQAPEIIVESYSTVQLPVPEGGVRSLRKAVKARKTAPQLVEVTVTAAEQSEAERLAAGLQTVTEKNVALYRDRGIPALEFQVVATQPWTDVTRPAVGLIAGSVFVVALILLINIQVLGESVRDESRG